MAIIKLYNTKKAIVIPFMIILLIVSSSLVVSANPTLSSAAVHDPTSQLGIAASGPSTISQDGQSDFTTQATLSSLTARPTNNIVNTNSFYDVVFLTASSGTIKFIQVTFPAGTIVPTSAIFNEAEGIGPGFISQISGQTVTYAVNNPVNIPAGTKIRLEFSNINNPLQVSTNYKVTVTTRDVNNIIIDGPTQSTAYTIKQIGKNAIADNSITSTKPAESFMKRVTVVDDAAGNAVGWNPDGVTKSFTITDSDVGPRQESFVSIYIPVTAAPPDMDQFCSYAGQGLFGGSFVVGCDLAPGDGSPLHYMVTRLPAHCIANTPC